ncbi:MAG: dipeptidyl-peptidase 3 family protein [Vicinamibacterales bacterium]
MSMSNPDAVSTPPAPPDTRPYLVEQVDEAAIVQLYADGFAGLPLREKALIWHLYLAAIAGRDIYYDQRYAHNLAMRDILEAVLTHAGGVDAAVLHEIRRYTKLFWINTGPYNNLTARKFVLNLEPGAFSAAVRRAWENGARLPLRAGETVGELCRRYEPMFFDPAFDPVVTSKTPGAARDILEASANNLYVGVRMADLDGFSERHPLNSRLVKKDGQLAEEVYCLGGRYGDQIARVVGHLEDALPYAGAATAEALRALIQFYQTGDDRDRERYDIAWVRDQESPVDTINGFVEVYMDARGAKGAWEALVYYVNAEKTRRIETLAAHAQWFENQMPWDPRYRKPSVLGVSAKAIEVVIETGDSGPVTPVGINLPNDQFIREAHGSKSVSLSNVSEAYEKATPEGMRVEFSWNADEAERAKRWGAFSSELTTEMHEVIGHGSGRMAEGITASPHQLLKEQFSAIEESRADLVALYFLPDPKLVELGLVAEEDHAEIVQTEYEYYARNALVQLRRVREGSQIEEDHMRNRHMIVSWLMAHTSAIEVRRRDGKTCFVMTDVRAFRDGVARLLAEVHRIKAEGDYEAARALFDTYGVHFDPALRDEVVARVDALGLPSYTGFIMPRLEARHAPDGSIVDVAISYPLDLEQQMLEYAAMTRGHSG